jgi:hypothetical protein
MREDLFPISVIASACDSVCSRAFLLSLRALAHARAPLFLLRLCPPRPRARVCHFACVPVSSPRFARMLLFAWLCARYFCSLAVAIGGTSQGYVEATQLILDRARSKARNSHRFHSASAEHESIGRLKALSLYS